MLLKTELTNPILDFLKTNLIQNLNILGILENLPNVSIYVDHLSEPTGVIVNHEYFNYIYTANPDFMETIVNDYLKDNEFWGFSGLEPKLADYLKHHMILNWESPCALYYLPKENFNPELKSSNTKPTSVAIEDAETINFFYTYKDDSSLERIRQDILNRPSSAIYVDGEIVSWLLVHEDNSMGIMFTKEGHRGKGYAVDLTIDLCSKLFDQNKIPFLQIVESNTMSPGLAKKCGFVQTGHAIWFGGFKGLPDAFIELSNQVKTDLETYQLNHPDLLLSAPTLDPHEETLKPKLFAFKGFQSQPRLSEIQQLSDQFIITDDETSQAVDANETKEESQTSKFKNITIYHKTTNGQIECAKVGLYVEEDDFPIVWRFEPTISPAPLDIWHGLFEYFRANGCTLTMLQPNLGRDYDNL